MRGRKSKLKSTNFTPRSEDFPKGKICFEILYIMKHLRFLRGAAAVSLGAVVSKGIGAVYRIVLSSLLSGVGMGLYQMAYPFFCLFLMLTSAGAGPALSRIVARERALGRSGRGALFAGLRLFAGLGGAGGMLLALLAPVLSALQGADLAAGYVFLAPAVLLCAVISVLRGYFQGRGRMAPTALSEVLETLVKAGLGVFFALLFRGDAPRAARFALLAVTLSEGAALIYLLSRLGGERCVPDLRPRQGAAELVPVVLPVMAASCILPLSQAVDSVLLPRLLGGGEGAVLAYGLLAGGALALASLPASAARGLAAAAVPSLAALSARGEARAAKKRALFALGAALLLVLPCALVLFFGAGRIASLLYPALSGGERALLVSLIRATAFAAPAVAGTDILAACLAGLGRASRAALSMLLAAALKVLLQIVLVPRMGAMGGAIAANACFWVAFSLDLLYTVFSYHRRNGQYDHDHRSGNARGGALASRRGMFEGGGKRAGARRIARLGGDAQGAGHPLREP